MPDEDHVLTALEQLAQAQTALERGHFGTVRMLLIRTKQTLNAELASRPAPEVISPASN